MKESNAESFCYGEWNFGREEKGFIRLVMANGILEGREGAYSQYPRSTTLARQLVFRTARPAVGSESTSFERFPPALLRPGATPPGPVKTHLGPILSETRFLKTLYKEARHQRSERVSKSFEEFRTSIFDHQRPFRCKMSAMVGNFRSYWVLEPLIGPKLFRNAVISEICGSLFLTTVVPLVLPAARPHAPVV